RRVAPRAAPKPPLLFGPGFWLALAAMIGAFAWPARAPPSGAFVIGTTASATVYVLSFLPFGVAADFRYAYWCVLAALAAAVVLFAAYIERRKAFSACGSVAQASA